MKTRIVVAISIGLFAGYLAYSFCRGYNRSGGDFGIAWWQARELLAGRTPYPQTHKILYPLPAALIAIPFTIFSADVAGGCFFGLSCALLAFAVTKDSWTRLTIFTAMPFAWSIVVTQWSPLMMASAFFPSIGAAVLKPQLGIPCAFRSRSWQSVWSALLIALAAVIAYPRWPIDFIQQARNFPHFYPLFYSIGPMMLLSLFWIKDPDVQFFLIMAVMPQRFMYDAFPLWLIPKTGKEVAFASLVSWCGFAYWARTLPNTSYGMVWSWSLIFNYGPIFLILLFRKWRNKPIFPIRLTVAPGKLHQSDSTR